MKKFITLFTLLFTTITFAQLITHSTVRLDEADHEGYLELENFWSKIHEQAISDDMAMFWAVWKVVKTEETPEDYPDFIIMNGWKDSIQMNKMMSNNWYEYGRKVYPKLSKRNFDKKWNLPFGTRNNYNYERIDNTVFIGQIEPGMTVQLNAFKQIDENYEKYETEFYKTWHEKGILNGSRRWWEFNKLLSSSENANKDITHVTIDIQGQELSEEEQQKLWETVTFTDQMMWQNGTKTRELVGQATLELVDFRN